MATDMPSSLKKGTSPTDRALIANAVAVSAVPTLSTDQMVPIGMVKNLDVVAKEIGGQNAAISVWWYYADADTWVLDTGIGVAGVLAVNANSTGGAVTIPSAASGLYVQVVTAPAGTDLSVWAIGKGSIGRG